MNNIWILIGSLSALLSVAIGAFCAQYLSSKLDEKALNVFSTANEYQFYHSFALILFGLFSILKLHHPGTPTLSPYSGVFFTLGILFFSGSLYALALSGVKILGAITPIGGVCFIIGWALFAYEAYK